MDATTLLIAALLLVAGLAIGVALGYALARSRGAPPDLAAMLGPASDAMSRVEAQLRQVERDRIDAYAGLREQVAALHRTSGELGAQASVLAGALRSPQVRGRWGELQLQRIVELAGMVEHCDFDTQVTARGEDGVARPDMVVRLAGNRTIPVDAKAPMAAWLAACEIGDGAPMPGGYSAAAPGAAAAPGVNGGRPAAGGPGVSGGRAAAGGPGVNGGRAAAGGPGANAVGGDAAARHTGFPDRAAQDRRRALLAQHARAVRAHVDALAGKAYWRMFHPAPEFVVMFVPGEAFLDAALSADPGLAEYAFERRVVIATPSTLIALLRTVAFTWRQERLSASAEQVHALGRQLFRRLTTFVEHLGKVGTGLDRAVTSYNAAVRSLDSRVLVSARRFADLGVTGDELPSPEQVDTAVTQSLPADPAPAASLQVNGARIPPPHSSEPVP